MEIISVGQASSSLNRYQVFATAVSTSIHSLVPRHNFKAPPSAHKRESNLDHQQ